MEQDITVLIVDDNIQFANEILEYINSQEIMHAVGIAIDGIQAIEMIKRLEPDIVLLDVVMPYKDGIGVLEDINSMELRKLPTFVMLTAIGQDTFIRKAITLGAEYYIIKPFDFQTLGVRILQIYNELNRPLFSDYSLNNKKFDIMKVIEEEQNSEIEIEVTKLMNQLGIPSNMSGYSYIREGIVYIISNSRTFISVTKDLYPVIAEKFETTPAKVERAIRGAIQKAWGKIDSDLANELFAHTKKINKVKPTNSEFIATIADKVKIKIKNK